MTVANKLPSMAVRNALAFVDLAGNYPSHCSYNTRANASRFVEFQYDDEKRRSSGRPYFLNDEGKAMAARSTLASCVEFLKARGFRLTERVGGRTAKPGYMPFVHADGRTAFVSSGRNVYMGRELAFEAKAVRS